VSAHAQAIPRRIDSALVGRALQIRITAPNTMDRAPLMPIAQRSFVNAALP
jgi:hypothetical protein